MGSRKDRFILAITGASGVVYAKRLFDRLVKKDYEIHLIISERGLMILREELSLSLDYFRKNRVFIYANNDFYNSLASGSFKTAGMVVVPASMGTIGRIAQGLSLDLVGRAADVILKEKGKLILVPRETPYNLIQLKNMYELAQAGAILIPASPAFYFKPTSIHDLVDFILAKILAHLGIEDELDREWKPL